MQADGRVCMQLPLRGASMSLEMDVAVAPSCSLIVCRIPESAEMRQKHATACQAATAVSQPELQLLMCAVHNRGQDICDVITFPVTTSERSDADSLDFQAHASELHAPTVHLQALVMISCSQGSHDACRAL
jgi:hypothetical protein